jgi:hypothetical protein
MQGRSDTDTIDRVNGSVGLNLGARKGKGRKCWVKEGAEGKDGKEKPVRLGKEY